ncbi:MAG: LpxI family protein, partial [Myxococcales bacterium]
MTLAGPPPPGERKVVGLIAGNGQFPLLFARGARRAGVQVVAIGHRGETDPALAAEVERLEWVHIGQLGRILDVFRESGVRDAAMAGGIGKLKAFRSARPDLQALKLAASLRRFQDDGFLKAIASAFEAQGVRIIPSTEYLREVLPEPGPLSARALTAAERDDVELGREVARAIGRADVGQTVVVRRGTVIAVEAAEGTDACIRRA